jgi:hypothetical protein
MGLKKLKTAFIVIMLLAFAGCVMQQQRVSVITGGEYNKEKDLTNYFVLPYGAVSIPGKWEKDHYNSVSFQQFFKNKDSVSLAVAFGACTQYEFNTNGALKGFKFVKAFYTWDTDYFVSKYGLQRSVIEQDSINNYMIYRVYGKTGQTSFDTYFLLGEKNGNSNSFSISITDKWTEEEKITFLRNLFLVKPQ